MKTRTAVEEARLTRDEFLARNWAIYSNPKHPDHRICCEEYALLTRHAIRTEGRDPDAPAGSLNPREPL